MAEPTSEKHYEEKFESQLWKMIKQRADNKDISYSGAYKEISPEWTKMIKYRDTEYEDAEIRKRNKELAELREIENKKGLAKA
jgi:hypothetical protein